MKAVLPYQIAGGRTFSGLLGAVVATAHVAEPFLDRGCLSQVGETVACNEIVIGSIAQLDR